MLRARTKVSVLTALLTVVLGVTLAPAAQADPAAGEALFREGRRLFEEGKIAEACLRFTDSQALDPSSGTLLNLADCHAEQGKTATAWAEFVAAAQLAQAQHKPIHEAEAMRRASRLERQLSYLTIEVKNPPAGLEVRRDALVIPAGVLGTRIPVDPGERQIRASAPGYETVNITVRVGAVGDHQRVTLPPLVPLPRQGREPALAGPQRSAVAQQPAAELATEAPGMGASSVLPWVIGGAGVAALATGGVFGVLALRSENDAKDACPTHTTCPESALDAERRRDRQAWIANIGVGAGLVGVGVAVVMLVTRDQRSASAAHRRPSARAVVFRPAASVAPGGFALRLTRAF